MAFFIHNFFSLDTAMIFFFVHSFVCRIVMKIKLLWKTGKLWISVNHSFLRTAKPKKHQNYFFKNGYLRTNHIITQTYYSIIVGFLRTKGKKHGADISNITVYLRTLTIYQRNTTQWFLFWSLWRRIIVEAWNLIAFSKSWHYFDLKKFNFISDHLSTADKLY